MNELQKLGKLSKKAFSKLKCKFSGTVCIDEVWIRQIKGKYVYVFAAVDAIYGHIIWIQSFMVKNKGDKSLASETFLNELKALGYFPKVILTDGDNCYPNAIKKVFNAIHQLCIFHVKQNIYEAFEPPKGMKLSKEVEELRDMVLAIFDVNNISKNEAVEFLKTALQSAIDMMCSSAVKLLKNLIKKKDRLFQYLKYDIPKSTGFVESLFSFLNQYRTLGNHFLRWKVWITFLQPQLCIIILVLKYNQSLIIQYQFVGQDIKELWICMILSNMSFKRKLIFINQHES